MTSTLQTTDAVVSTRRSRARTTVGLLGPTFVVSVAYVDPGNVAANFTAGAQRSAVLFGVVVAANLIASFVQYQTSKIGLLTGRSLPELCRHRFGTPANVALWAQAEVVAVATDLAEFIGAAVGLHLLTGMSPLAAGMITAAASLAVLAARQGRARRLEIAVVALLALTGAGFLYLGLAAALHAPVAFHLGTSIVDSRPGTLNLAIAIVGATVMPHAIYLHSALQAERTHGLDVAQRHRLLRASRWDCTIALGAAMAVNLCMFWAGAQLSRIGDGAASGQFDALYHQIGILVGHSAAIGFGLALIASGLSSSAVGTLAGDVVMAGFLRRRVPAVVRRLITILPALAVLAAAIDVGNVLIDSQIVLSMGVPVAVVLVIVARSDEHTADATNRPSRPTLVSLATLAVGLSIANAVLIWQLIGT